MSVGTKSDVLQKHVMTLISMMGLDVLLTAKMLILNGLALEEPTQLLITAFQNMETGLS